MYTGGTPRESTQLHVLYVRTADYTSIPQRNKASQLMSIESLPVYAAHRLRPRDRVRAFHVRMVYMHVQVRCFLPLLSRRGATGHYRRQNVQSLDLRQAGLVRRVGTVSVEV